MPIIPLIATGLLATAATRRTLEASRRTLRGPARWTRDHSSSSMAFDTPSLPNPSNAWTKDTSSSPITTFGNIPLAPIVQIGPVKQDGTF